MKDDARRQPLELVAASLTQAYYNEHTTPNRDYRELLDTYSLSVNGGSLQGPAFCDKKDPQPEPGSHEEGTLWSR